NQVIPLHQIPEFFQRDLIVLKQEMNAVLTDSVNQIRIINSEFKPVVTVKKESAGWLDFNITFESSGFHLPQSILEKAKAENEKYIQLEPSTWIAFDKKNYSKIEQELSDLNAISGEFGFRVPVSEFATLEEFINSIGGRSELDKAYQDFLDQLIGFVPDHKFSLPAEIESHLENENLHLRPYQRGGIQWLHWLKQNQLHGILADDMGLGKTLESLIALRMGLLEDTNNINHSLIVAPKSVLIHWEREILRVFPTVNIHLYQGSNRNKNILKSNQPYIVITTYETITKDADFFARIPFYYLILDEATRIKNPDSHRSRAIKSLNAAHRLALSGTPVENRPSELWSLFDFLMRGHLGKQGTFKNVFEQAIISGDDSAAQRLGKRIRPFLLRRKKEDVATDIPEKIEITEWVTLTSEQRMLYASLQAEITGLRNKIINGNISNYSFSVLPVLTKLKQICDHPALLTGKINPIYNRSEKFDWMIEKIEEINNDNEQVVVFSHFLNMLSIFESAIKEKGISYIRIDGSTNNRQEYIDIFNNGKARVALLSLMATGYGINLTAANHVIHADRWWNPAVEDQATDRVHRIGQNKTVYVYQVLNQGTMEEKIELLLSKKRGMANQIINAATRGSSRWSREELLELLSPLG
ncbi:MAG: DEAD/DEAH box helicase, partial [Chloroflexota bacterium]